LMKLIMKKMLWMRMLLKITVTWSSRECDTFSCLFCLNECWSYIYMWSTTITKN
jgi:hypothetical protein